MRSSSHKKLNHTLTTLPNKQNFPNFSSTLHPTTTSYTQSAYHTSLDHSFAPSHSQNLKLAQAINHIKLRHEQFQRHQAEECYDYGRMLEKLGRDVEKCREGTFEATKNTLLELQQANTSVTDKQEIVKSSLNSQQKQQLDQLITNKIEPRFASLRETLSTSILNHTSHQLQSLQQKIHQTLETPTKKQSQQRSTQMFRIIDASTTGLQYLQTEISELNKITEDHLTEIEEKLEMMKYEMQANLEAHCEGRRREDKMIEQLIEKIIYKMTYL